MLLDETAFIHAKPAGGQMQLVEIAVVVRYHHHRLAGLLQRRQQLVVELAPKIRILVGGPFVQQQDRTLLQQAHDQREALALAAREVEGAKLAVGEARLVAQPELRQQPIDLGGVRIGNPIEPLKQMIVNENRGDQCAVGIARCCRRRARRRAVISPESG